MNKGIISEFEGTLNEFITHLSSFSGEQFNNHPSQGSWTAGQVGEHIRQSLKGGGQLLITNTKPPERPADQFVEDIRSVMLDFSRKLNSPEFIIPPDIHYNKNIMLHELSKAKEIGAVAKTLDLSELCMGFAFPVLGYLTRLEIIHFYTSHIKRHIHQLKGITEKLKEQVSVQ
jgi:hypothetical protein